MRQVGLAIGYALLGLVDAAVPAALLAGAVYYVGPLGTRTVTVAAVVGLVSLAVGAVIGAIAAWRGGRPFPLARGANRVWERLWWVSWP